MADNRTAEGRSKNRRVEIEVVGTRSSEPKAPTMPKGLVPVLFGTTRAKTQTNDPYTYFGSVEADGPAEGRLTLGRVLVRVPPVRQRGDIKEPSYVSFAIEKMTRSSVASFIGLSPIAAADPLTDFAFAGPVEEFTPAAFGKSLEPSSGHELRVIERRGVAHVETCKCRSASWRRRQWLEPS